jgi:hypothetical protein
VAVGMDAVGGEALGNHGASVGLGA